MNSHPDRSLRSILLVPIVAVLSVACGDDSVSQVGPTDGGDASHGSSSSGGVSSSGGSSSGSSSGATSSGGSSSSSSSGGVSSSSSSGGTDGGTSASTLAVNLGTAANYVVLAKTGISDVPTSAITGNIAVSPAAATYITGFALTADSTNVFSTAPQVTGKVYAADYAAPTPAVLTAAIGDMQLAFADAAGRAPKVTELGTGNIGGMTLTPGVYKWSTALLIPASITLAGGATDVWVFQIAQNLMVSSATNVVLTGGAVSQNVFWQVAGLADLGTTAQFEGVILSQTSIVLEAGASINGRLLAQTAVTLSGNTVVQP